MTIDNTTKTRATDQLVQDRTLPKTLAKTFLSQKITPRALTESTRFEVERTEGTYSNELHVPSHLKKPRENAPDSNEQIP
jgi:hypothetical protein